MTELTAQERASGRQLLSGIQTLLERSRDNLPLDGSGDVEATTCALQLGESLRLEVRLPIGAIYSEKAPVLPTPGMYCFPSGNFDAERDLGWRMEQFRVRRKPDGVRVIVLQCRKCGAAVTLKVGPFITTMTVPPGPPIHEKH